LGEFASTSLFANRTFVLHTTAATTSAGGTAAAQVAVVFAVLGVGGSAGDVGTAAVAGLVPALMFFLIGGAIADRWPRNLVLVAANTLSALSQGVLAVLILTGQARLGHMVAVSALNGLAMAFAMPASRGLLMRAVGREHGPRAFAVFRLALNLAQIGGAAFGGVLVSVAGSGWSLGFDALTFAITVVLLLSVRIEGTFSTRGNLLGELREGWAEFRARRWLGPVIVLFAAVNTLAVGAFERVLGPVGVAGTGGGAAWGAIMACDATGMVLAGFVMLRWTPARPLRSAIGGGGLTTLPILSVAGFRRLCGRPDRRSGG